MTSQFEISQWFDEAKEKGATHLMVCVDTFDHGDYHVCIMPGEDPQKKFQEHSDPNKMSRVMEVYSMALPKEKQLLEMRSFHFETEDKSSKFCVPSHNFYQESERICKELENIYLAISKVESGSKEEKEVLQRLRKAALSLAFLSKFIYRATKRKPVNRPKKKATASKKKSENP